VTSLLALWWAGAKRQSGGSAALILLFAIAAAAHGHSTLVGPRGEVAYYDGLFIVGTLTAVTLPLLLREADIFGAVRLRLLPVSTNVLLALRLVIGRPLRTMMVAVVLFWGSWAGISMFGTWVGMGASLRMLAWLMLGIVVIDLVEQVGKQHAPELFNLGVLFLFALVLPSFLFYPIDAPATVALLGSLPGWLVIVQPFSAHAGRASTLSLIAPAAAAAVLLAVQSKLANTGFLAGAPRQRATKPLLRAIPGGVKVRKEVALLTRTYFARALHAVAFAICGFSALTGLWSLLPLSALAWITLSHNHFGPDVPLGGRSRYQLTPISLYEVLRARRSALFMLGGMVLTAGAVAGALIHRESDVLLWGASAVFGMSILGATMITGDRMSLRWPKPIGLRDVLIGGGFLHGRAWWGVVTVYIGTIASVIAAFMMLYPLLKDSERALTVAGLLLSAGILAAASAVSAHLLRSRYRV
jgi:hypothetical protein